MVHVSSPSFHPPSRSPSTHNPTVFPTGVQAASQSKTPPTLLPVVIVLVIVLMIVIVSFLVYIRRLKRTNNPKNDRGDNQQRDRGVHVNPQYAPVEVTNKIFNSSTTYEIPVPVSIAFELDEQEYVAHNDIQADTEYSQVHVQPEINV
eukprot:m.76037 g.76037  ORF g.76037 m.76037 type:complete len:148 (+) comp24851_c0_seq1:1063-1506(+)